MPAEVSLYSLQFIDRIIIVRSIGLAEAGLYALAFKFSQAVQIVVRGFQLAWPPLAYSIQDDDEARRTYAVVLTAFSAVCGFLVVGLWLEARWIVRVLADGRFFDAWEVVGPLALGAALYGVYLAQLVILGRTGKTDRNLPATLAGVVSNVVLNLILVPAYGIVGAGVALIVSYLLVIVLMYAFTQRLVPIPWQWGRLAVIVVAGAALVVGGELLLPDEGFSGFVLRAALWLTYPVLLWFGGVVTPDERATAIAAIRAGRERRETGEETEDLIEAETRDQDRSGF
jgi:O-antigen/teichoic acid export membrane protein